jgi:hypothetical protein
MKYRVEKQGDNISVQIDDVAGQEQVLLEAIRRCRQGAWACQSGECMNIGTMEERVERGSVFLTLIPRPGAQIDRAGIEICLRYMLAPRDNPVHG